MSLPSYADVWRNNSLRLRMGLQLHNNRLYPMSLSSDNDIQTLCAKCRRYLTVFPRLSTDPGPKPAEMFSAFAADFSDLASELTAYAQAYENARRIERLSSGASPLDPIDHLPGD